MQTTVESTDRHTVKLTIEVPADRVEADLNQTYRAIAREVKIPGFRPGKAPKAIIDAQIGRDAVLEEYVSATLPTYFHSAVTDEDLAPIGDPDVDVEQLEPGKALIFTATVEVRPRLTFEDADYRGIEVRRPAVEVTDDEVDAWVERLRRQFGELEPVGRPAAAEDFVTITVGVTRDGAAIDALGPRGLPVQRGLRGARRDLRRAAPRREGRRHPRSSTARCPSGSARSSGAARRCRSGCS